MATRFLDSFLHYNTSQILRKWTNSVNTIGAWVITPGVGRWGTAGLVYTLNSAGRVLQKTLDNQQTWVVGVAMKWNTLPGSTDAIIVVYDGGSRQVDLRVSPTGQLVATRNGTVLGTSAAALASGSFAFVEIKVVIASGAGGSFTVTVNGVAVLTLTAINTQATGNAFASTVGLGSPDGNSTGQTVTFSDLHILDGTGSVTNTLIGDCRVDCLLPASDSAIVQWNPGGSGGATHYTHVNEVPADDDTSYVQDNVVGHEDEYGMGALAAVPVTIYGVQIVLMARKIGSGSRSIAGAVHSGLVDVVGSGVALGDQYGCVLTQQQNDPSTSLPWTAVGIAAAAFGPAVTA